MGYILVRLTARWPCVGSAGRQGSAPSVLDWSFPDYDPVSLDSGSLVDLFHDLSHLDAHAAAMDVVSVPPLSQNWFNEDF
ncbi:MULTISPECIES: hypothetical protein [Paenibacillus]|uniref:hypothetical protein n=1 Tax=Paenibacillus TaxID=44249 RepID=UPI000FD6600A|nr:MULTISPECIES: hypothetical protein [Paenibacillus]MCY9662839.1 hypothetical protein [Paenibacillus anseongense]